MQMQYLGETLTPWWINSEVGTLAGDGPPHGKLFRYLRYDVKLELPWIEENYGPEIKQVFGRSFSEIDVIRMRSMDDPTIVETIYKLARIAAEKQVKAEHWLGDIPDWCDPTSPRWPRAARCGPERAKMPSRTMLPRMLARVQQIARDADRLNPAGSIRPSGKPPALAGCPTGRRRDSWQRAQPEVLRCRTALQCW
jgi:hypothetical protein